MLKFGEINVNIIHDKFHGPWAKVAVSQIGDSETVCYFQEILNEHPPTKLHTERRDTLAASRPRHTCRSGA